VFADPRLLLAQVLALLVVGGVVGLIARLVLRGRWRVSMASTALVGMLGVAVAATVLDGLLDDPGRYGWKMLLASVASTAALLVLVAALARRFSPQAPPPPIAEQIAAGESERVEFKSSARWNLHTGQRDPAIEQVVAKTVAAFLNASGGTLLVGIDDDGRPLGLERDFALVKSPDRDRYELWLRDLLRGALGAVAVAAVRVDFDLVEDREVCRLVMAPAPQPAYLRPGKGGDQQFWVRSGNSTRQLSVEETVDYARHRWPASIGEAVRGQWRTAIGG